VKDSSLTIFYCGADMSWGAAQQYGFRRRNTCLLKSLSEQPEVTQVVVPVVVKRRIFLRNLLRRKSGATSASGKVRDLGVAFLFPESWTLIPARWLNRLLVGLQIRLQVAAIEPGRIVTWCYWPAGFRLARRLGLGGSWVFDADHNVVADVNQDSAARKEIEALLAECARKCDLVVAGSRSMLRWFEGRGGSARAYLRNGVDPGRFARATGEPEELRKIPRPRVGYSGSLSKWVDYDLLARLARKRPDWSFVVIGGNFKADGRAALDGLANVTLLGERAAGEVPALLAALDVGLVLYDTRFRSWLDGDSMKIFEYLAAGLPTVTTPFHAELEGDFDHLLEIAPDASGFEAAISALLDLTPETRADWDWRRSQFVARNTWKCRAKEAVDLIRTHCFAADGRENARAEPALETR